LLTAGRRARSGERAITAKRSRRWPLVISRRAERPGSSAWPLIRLPFGASKRPIFNARTR